MNRLGIDIGGTFTDGVLVAENGFYVFKVSSTPKSPEIAVYNLIQEMEEKTGIALSNVQWVVHGSTVATNAVIERRGARTCLITTHGFRDILEIQRHEKSDVYNIFYTKPVPLVSRDRVIEIHERIGADGATVQEVDEQEVKAKIEELLRRDSIDSLAICLLYSYKNPQHERQVKDVVCGTTLFAQVVLSSEILPEYREYERASTTVISAYLGPIVQNYVSNLNEHFETVNYQGNFQVMQANGGIMPWQTAKDKAVNMIFSGPAAGVIGAMHVAKQAGFNRLISFDVGGTSTDISLVSDEGLTLSKENTIDGLPINIPMIDIHTLGAGGGSIVWVDAGGALRVGPASAGAQPGPICYRRDGDKLTLTDVYVVANFIRPGHFLGGNMQLDGKSAMDALHKLADYLLIDYLDLIEGVIKVAASGIARELHLISVERGYDPRDYALVAFGGAGGLLAVALAEELNIQRVIIPEHPGLLSALGLLVSDFRRDFVQTEIVGIEKISSSHLKEIFTNLQKKAIDEMSGYHDPDKISFIHSVEMRYTGQSYSLSVPAPFTPTESMDMEAIKNHFNDLYLQQYGHFHPDKPVEFVNFRLSSIVKVLHLQHGKRVGTGTIAREKEPICFRGKKMACDFYTRETLPVGYVVQGPAIVEEPTSTSFIPPVWEGKVDQYGNIIVERKRQ